MTIEEIDLAITREEEQLETIREEYKEFKSSLQFDNAKSHKIKIQNTEVCLERFRLVKLEKTITKECLKNDKRNTEAMVALRKELEEEIVEETRK